jgi:cobalamin synthase
MRWFDVKWFAGRRAILLPVYGAAIGAIGAAVYLKSPKALPNSAAAFLAAALWTALALLPREQTTRVNVIAIGAAFAVRWLAIDHLATGAVLPIFVAAQTVPRAAMIVLAWMSRPAPSGSGYAFSSTLNTWIALIAMAMGIAAAFACGLRPAAMILAGAYLIGRLVQWISYRVRGGLNAESLGVTQLSIELYVLLIFDCATCRW